MSSVFRIGYGYDVHQLASGRRLMVGGVTVSEEIGCVAHSDGDVLLHAICDALLGAAALGDIGKHFPDTDVRYKGISSLLLLEKTWELVSEHGYAPGNIDATIILEKPKIMPFIDRMRENIADVLKCSIDDVSVKATTSEKLGYIGEGRGIAAHAVALIYWRG